MPRRAGPSKEEERRGRTYKCLFLGLPDRDWRRAGREEAHPRTLEGTIAHEIAHLRWWTLDHGTEFDARVLALLHGAQFPPRGGWSSKPLRIMREKRNETKAWLARRIARLT
jgi:hypothetical protein